MSVMHDLASCSSCGVYPWDAPLGEFCPASDPDDLDLHQFGRRTEERVPLPPRSSVGRPARALEAIDGRPENEGVG